MRPQHLHFFIGAKACDPRYDREEMAGSLPQQSSLSDLQEAGSVDMDDKFRYSRLRASPGGSAGVSWRDSALRVLPPCIRHFPRLLLLWKQFDI